MRREKFRLHIFPWFSIFFNKLTHWQSDDKKLCVCKCVHERFFLRALNSGKARRKYQMEIHAISEKFLSSFALLHEHFFRACNFVLNFFPISFCEGEKKDGLKV